MSADVVVPHDRGPRIAVLTVGGVGLLAIGFGATFLGVLLVLAALAGGIATAVGPVLTRRSARMGDIVVPRWTGADTQAMATEQRRLTTQLSDGEQVAAVVRPRLAALIEGRLGHRGVEPGSPEAAALLGAPLVAFLTDTRRRAISAAAFGALLDRVEAL